MSTKKQPPMKTKSRITATSDNPMGICSKGRVRHEHQTCNCFQEQVVVGHSWRPLGGHVGVTEDAC